MVTGNLINALSIKDAIACLKETEIKNACRM
jgi:hypothetical protein